MLPRATLALPRGTGAVPNPAELLPPPRAIHPPAKAGTSIASTVGSSGASLPPHPTPAPSQDGAMPNPVAPCGRGCPPAPGREVPPAAKPGPGSVRAAGAVSISRGALLEKEQKLREAINSRLLHTSASSAPASSSQGGGVRQHAPRSAPPSTPPPRFWANVPIRKPEGIKRWGIFAAEAEPARSSGLPSCPVALPGCSPAPGGFAAAQPGSAPTNSPRGWMQPPRDAPLAPAQPSLALAAAGWEQGELSGSGRPTFKALILFA